MIVKNYTQILLGILLYTAVFSQSLEIPDQFINKDGTRNLPIYIYDVIDLEGIEFTLEYDDEILIAEDVFINTTDFFEDDYDLISNIDMPGTIQVEIYVTNNEFFSGNGLIAQISFAAIGELGEISDITFSNSVFYNNEGIGGGSEGGALRADGAGNIAFYNCILVNNSSGNGGGIMIINSIQTVFNNSIAILSPYNQGQYRLYPGRASCREKSNMVHPL